MGLPILKYVDVALGLAVVILLICTIVTAVAQMALSFTYSRARYLRDGLEDLICQLDPDTLSGHARYIAERCLRHPLVSRNNTLFGQFACNIRNWFRAQLKAGPPLPRLNPPDVLERDELVLILLEWASGDGPLALQDKQLSPPAKEGDPVNAPDAARDVLKTAIANNGIADPGTAAKAIRAKIVDLENANPGQASAVSRSLAIAAAAPSEFVGKIHVWFDNTMARISNQYGLLAQVWAAALAFLVVFSCQFDALDLIKRLSEDDKLRADLVQQAKDQTARIDDAQKKVDAAKKDPPQTAPPAENQDTKEIADATLQRQQVSASLAVLRDPNRAIIPNYFLWQKIAQTKICITSLNGTPGQQTGKIIVDADSRAFQFVRGATSIVDLAVAIRSTGAPVTVYPIESEGGCLRLVARDYATSTIKVQLTGPPPEVTSDPTKRDYDKEGAQRRLAGMAVGTILVALGAPFWFDLLKKLLGFRSSLASKDDSDRQQRQGQQDPVPTAAPTGAHP